ncbi:NAD/NADP-dependent betaine aldehyde dehydrogenase [Achromobacter insolitus]|uniref:aldehyde dehydrogenase family protein n=1 Tax=Achromobacter insolitus TaxID=217204 RepID=UPI0014684093|nr:aldehyde dehydrogenase family protein [Achromobacter insolitus]CAB3954311.1 NAD/NADP-dependent betaine aldehyde dehydrogenase [Achromobacter insolitus]
MDVIDSRPYDLLIGESWRAGAEGRTFDTFNPATAQVLARVHEASAADVDAAVQAAHAAYETHWRRTTPAHRGKLLRRLAELFERDREKLAWIETLNVGKPITHSLDSLKGMPASLEYFAGIIPALRGETIPVGNVDVLNFTIREPLGVCALIMPWNYPMTLTVNKLGPALAAGNTVILKPSEVTPLSSMALARLFEEAGFPPGVINVVNGPGATVGERLVTHPLVSRVSFTGGTVTGARIQAAAAADVKRVTLELGGKSPLIVFEDAPLDKAVAVAAGDLIKNSGQVCIACTRLLVQESVREEFLGLLQQRLDAVRIGAPTDPATEMGPLASAAQKQRVEKYVGLSAEEGALPARYGQMKLEADTARGYFVPPTLLLNSHARMQSAQDEIFGPVQSLIGFRDEAEALRIANDTRYGLAAVLYTRDGGRALRMARGLQSGSVAINTGLRTSFDAPFGGYKQSGIGKERGLEAIYENTQLKNVKYDTTI